MKKQFLITIGAALLIIGATFFFVQKKTSTPNTPAEQTKTPLSVHAESIADRQIASFDFSYPGIISSEGEADLTAQVSGTIVSASLVLNKSVSTGQTLFRIDDTSSSLEQKNGTQSADLQTAALSFQNAKKAYQEAVRNDHQQGNSASESAKIQAKNSRDLAEVAYTALLDKRVVKSPISGTVTVKNVSVGDTVSVGTPLATISRGKKTIRFFVSDTERLLLAPGQTISFSKDADGKNGIAGTILRVSQAADPQSKRFLVEAESTDPKFKDFSTSSIVTVFISVSKKAQPGNFFLPLSAVLNEQNGSSVFIYDNGKVKSVPVTIENIDGETVELSGITDQQTLVITTDVKRLKDGDITTLD